MRDLVGRSWPRALVAIAAGSVCMLMAASPALAQDTAPPVLNAPSFATPPNGNGPWRITAPQTLNLSATDDVAVAKFQYSLDGGATYIDVPVTAGPSASASVELSQEGNTAVRVRAVDSAGNPSRGATTNTTLNQAAEAGATAVRLTSTTGRSAGDILVIDTGDNQETVTIASIVTPAPPSPEPNVTLTTPLQKAHAASAAVAGIATYSTITLQLDTKPPVATWGTAATTTQAPAAAGATAIRLASLTNRVAGETLQLDQGSNAETVKIATIITPAPPAPEPNVTLTSPLTKDHLSGVQVYVPQIVDGKVMQSQTLTPLRTDPRFRDPTDTTANGAGGAAPRRMTIDGEFMIPKTLELNRLTVGKHTQTVSVQDVAGNAAKYVNTFVVTTSFDDLATVIDQYANNALRTTLNGATQVGATGVRLAFPAGFGTRAGQQIVIDTGDNQETATIARVLSPPPTLNTTLSAPASAGDTRIRLASYSSENLTGPNPPSNNGPVIGQPIVIGTGADQEVVTVKRHISPLPPAPQPNVELSAPLAKDHAQGTATSLVNVILENPLTKAHANGVPIVQPRPLLTAAKADELRTLLADAKAKADAGETAAAITALQAFTAAAAVSRPIESAGEALIAQLQGQQVDTSGTGITVEAPEPGVQALRVFNDPVPFQSNPNATYKILVSGRAGGFRHQSIVDFHWMFQQLGAEHGFDVDIWDPNINGSPGRQAPPGVSLPTSPFLDLETLKQYKTIVFNSTVGINNTATLNAVEFANLQAYVRQGGGVIAIHGGTDSMQNVPWYMDLVGAGFTNHGSNAGGILIETESGGHVEFINADPAHATTAHLPARFFHVEELYNTNRNPAEMGIVHPLMYENEDTLVGQLGYGAGALLNSDKHAMTWCRHFDGGRSFTTTLGHNWQFAMESWWRTMMLKAVQWTAGQTYANCVTFNEVRDLLDAAAEDGAVTGSGAAALRSALDAADAAYRADDFAGAAAAAKQFVAETKKVENVGSDGGAALLELQYKGTELVNWMSGNEAEPPAPKFVTDQSSTVGGSVPATLALTLGGQATFGAFTPGVARDYTASTTATVISTAGDALLSVSDPSSEHTGKLVNGAFALPQTLQAAVGTAFAPVGGAANPTALTSWSNPTSNESVTISFKQSIGANDALRTGTYSKALTFTLSTTTP